MENLVHEPTGNLVRTINYSTDQSQQVLLFRLICRMFSQELTWCERLRASAGEQSYSRGCESHLAVRVKVESRGEAHAASDPLCSEQVAVQVLSLKHHQPFVYFDVTITSKEGSRGLCSSTKW